MRAAEGMVGFVASHAHEISILINHAGVFELVGVAEDGHGLAFGGFLPLTKGEGNLGLADAQAGVGKFEMELVVSAAFAAVDFFSGDAAGDGCSAAAEALLKPIGDKDNVEEAAGEKHIWNDREEELIEGGFCGAFAFEEYFVKVVAEDEGDVNREGLAAFEAVEVGYVIHFTATGVGLAGDFVGIGDVIVSAFSAALFFGVDSTGDDLTAEGDDGFDGNPGEEIKTEEGDGDEKKAAEDGADAKRAGTADDCARRGLHEFGRDRVFLNRGVGHELID